MVAAVDGKCIGSLLQQLMIGLYQFFGTSFSLLARLKTKYDWPIQGLFSGSNFFTGYHHHGHVSIMATCMMKAVFWGKFLVWLFFPWHSIKLTPKQILLCRILNIKHRDDCSLNTWDGVKDVQIIYLR